LGQGRALPTELLPRLLQKHLAKVATISFWGKVGLYQLSYFRGQAFYFAIANVEMFRRFSKESMKFFQKTNGIGVNYRGTGVEMREGEERK
jgi:hypothetical protein